MKIRCFPNGDWKGKCLFKSEKVIPNRLFNDAWPRGASLTIKNPLRYRLVVERDGIKTGADHNYQRETTNSFRIKQGKDLQAKYLLI